jgi:hypothetical protein
MRCTRAALRSCTGVRRSVVAAVGCIRTTLDPSPVNVNDPHMPPGSMSRAGASSA